MRRIIQNMLAVMAAISAPAVWADSIAQEYEIRIERQPLGAVLTEVARQTGLSVLMVGKTLDQNSMVVVGPLDGRYTVDAALDAIVTNIGLDFVRVNETTIAVVEKSRGKVRLARLDTEPRPGSSLPPARPNTELGPVGRRVDLGGLEEITVTAQRREENLQDVPISISALSAESLESGEVTSLNDALHDVPGFAGYENAQGGMTRYSIRGVSTNISLLNSASVVGYYLDEIPFAFVRFPVVPDANPYDLVRVEALRGPQGTLYGASSLNGVIRVVTQDASLDRFEWKVRTGLSSTRDGGESYRGDAAVNVPLIANKLGVRVVAGYEDEGGWIDLPAAGIEDANDRQTKNLRLKVNARPVENFGIELMNWLSRTDRGYPSASRDDRTSSATFPAAGFETNFDAHGLTLSYEFPWAALTSSTSWMSFDSTGLQDGGGIVASRPIIVQNHLEADLMAQEVRLASTGAGPWKWSAGGIYRDEEDQFVQDVFFEDTLAKFSQVPGRTIYNSRSYAFFGELSRLFFDGRIELTGGMRYFHDTNSNNEPSAYDPSTGAAVTAAEKSATVKSDALTSRVVLAYRPSDTTSLYVSFGEGFRAGFSQTGIARRSVPPAVVPLLPVVEPDKLRNYEVGAKGTALGGMLSYDLAAYYIDWKDAVQVQLYASPDNSLLIFIPLNSEGVDGVGADAGVTLQFADRWKLGATVSWNDLQFTDSVLNGTAVLYAKGSRPPESSEMTAGADLSYHLPLGSSYSAELSGAINYTTKLVTATASGPTEGDDLLRARASFTLSSDSGWSVMLFGDNLTDEDGRIRPAVDLITSESDRLRPRTFGLQLDYRF